MLVPSSACGIIAVQFELVGEITDVEPIAVGKGVRIRHLLVKRYGRGRWRKLKGVGRVRLRDGTERNALFTLTRHTQYQRKTGEVDKGGKLPENSPPK